MPTATITLKISAFVATADGNCTILRPVISPGGGGNRVYFKSNDPTSADYNTIVVKSKGKAELDLAFVIQDSNGSNTVYSPTSIQFEQTTGTSDPTGTADFKSQVISTNTITVTDVFANVGLGATRPAWEYSILVNDAAGVGGKIDPGIENSDEN